MTAKKKKLEDTHISHDRWAYIVTIQSEKKYIPYTILVVSKTELTLAQVVKRFETPDYPETAIIKVEHPGSAMVWILE
jgi:hypothetical protein